MGLAFSPAICKMDRPNCFKCRHLVITWEKERSYACRAMRFKSKEIPWRVVLRESGTPCLLFSPKDAPPPPPKQG
jgi:hypothetical protein